MCNTWFSKSVLSPIHPERYTPEMSFSRICSLHVSACAVAFVLLAFTACESSFKDNGTISLDELNGRTTTAETETRTETETRKTSAAATPATASRSDDQSPTASSSSSGTTSTTSVAAAASEIVGIRWLGPNFSSWPITTTLSAKISGGTIHMKYNKANVWPVHGDVVANCWAIVNIHGTWYAGTFEYLRKGQTSKPTSVLDGSKGDHFKKQPLSSWRPKSGERFGLMVSGLCRTSARNVSERSNICMVTWP